MTHSLFLIFEIIGTVAFAISGAMSAIEKKLDIFGVAIIGITTAVGGGVIRDVIIGITPPQMFVNPVYAVIAGAVSLLICIPAIRRLMSLKITAYNWIMIVSDSIGLGIFTSIGVIGAYNLYPDNLFLMAFVGVISGVGGGVLRDVMLGNIPYIFIKHIYACAALMGALTCAIMLYFCPVYSAVFTGAAVTVAIRLLAARYKINLPRMHM